MVSLLAFLVATQVPIQQPPRLRTLLPNGALVLVERVPGARSLMVDLFASARGVEETAKTHGYRHLIEHLVALGRNGDLDRRLESQAAFLSARTYRDSMVFELNLPKDGLQLGLSAVGELLTVSSFTPESIQREGRIIGEEMALREPNAIASGEAWEEAFGERGLDPIGSSAAIQTATPEGLQAIRKRMFAAANIALVISGDVDLDRATEAARDALSSIPSPKPAGLQRAVTEKPVVTVRGSGSFRGVAVPGFRSPATAAAMAAAFALSAQNPRSEVMYTPSARPGLVLLGAPSDITAASDPAGWFDFGRRLAMRWIRARLADPASAAAFRGMLMVQERDLRPETMIENLEVLDFAEFSRAYRSLATGESPR